MTCDIGHVEGGENSLKITGPQWRSEGVLKIFAHKKMTDWLNQLIYYKGVSGKTLARPGLLQKID